MLSATVFGWIALSLADAPIAIAQPALSRNQILARINRLSQPVGDHGFLNPLIGVWRGQGVARVRPGMKFERVRCRLRARWILGRRFVEQTLKCVGDDYKLEGRGFIGFDRIARRYVGAWISGADTGYTAVDGRRTDAVTFVLRYRHNDPIAGKKVTTTTTITIANARRHSHVATMLDAKSATQVVVLKIVYTR
jgi:hypothetical protein